MPQLKQGDMVTNLNGNYEYEVVNVGEFGRVDIRSTQRLENGEPVGKHIGTLWRDVSPKILKPRPKEAHHG